MILCFRFFCFPLFNDLSFATELVFKRNSNLHVKAEMVSAIFVIALCLRKYLLFKKQTCNIDGNFMNNLLTLANNITCS